MDEIPSRGVVELLNPLFTEKHFKAINNFLQRDLSLVSSSADRSKTIGVRDHWSYTFLKTRVFRFLTNLVHVNPSVFTERIANSFSWVESIGQPSSTILTPSDIKARATAAAFKITDIPTETGDDNVVLLEKHKSNSNLSCPVGWNTKLSWHMPQM